MIWRAKTTGFHVCITILRSHLRVWNLQLNLRRSRWDPTQRTPTSGRSTQALHPHLVADGGAVVLVVAVPRPVSMRAVHHLQPPVPEACLPEQGKRCRLVMLVEPSHDRMDIKIYVRMLLYDELLFLCVLLTVVRVLPCFLHLQWLYKQARKGLPCCRMPSSAPKPSIRICFAGSKA